MPFLSATPTFEHAVQQKALASCHMLHLKHHAQECQSPVLPATNTVEPAARAGHCAVLRASTVVPTVKRSSLLAMLVVAGACMCGLFSMHICC